MRFSNILWVTFLVANNLCCHAMDGLKNLFGAIEDLAGAVATCEYECPNGEDPIKKAHHVPVSNGCGSYGFRLEIDNFPDLTPCCNTHDICYDTCGNSKTTCDRDFNDCLAEACKRMKKTGILSKKEYKGCKTTADLLYGGLRALGCSAYLDSQENACICPSKKTEL